MAITASGLYMLSEEKKCRGTLGGDMESETVVFGGLVLDAYTHNYDTHDFRNDITNEASGTGYTSGGKVITGTEVLVGSPAAGQMRFDHDDVSWATSTISSAMALYEYIAVGTAATDPLLLLLDFVTAVTTSTGLLTVQIAANGAYYLDGTP